MGLFKVIKHVLKKTRWKWHHDLTVQMDEETGRLCKKLGEVQEQVKRLEDQWAVCSRKLVQIQNDGGLDSFAWHVEMEKAFCLLEDRESQKLFWARMHFSKFRNLVPLFRYLMQSDRGGVRDIIWLLQNRANRSDLENELVIFGTTNRAKELLLIMRGLGCKVDYICREDNATQFTPPSEPPLSNFDWLGVPVITEAELFSAHKDAQIIAAGVRCGAAKNYLIKKGIPENNIYRRHTQWEKQYLAPDIMRPHQHEVYIDGGVLDLSNTLEFIEWCGGEYDDVYAFEPDENNYKKCIETIQNNQLLDENRVHLFQAALWERDEDLVFQGGESGSSKVNDGGNSAVQGRSIDSVLQGGRVTFIKLDIEGAEMNALIGAQESIRKWKPRLAICIYHRPEDPIEIPLYIHGLVPEYKMYIRHYATCKAETVLYCVCDDMIADPDHNEKEEAKDGEHMSTVRY